MRRDRVASAASQGSEDSSSTERRKAIRELPHGLIDVNHDGVEPLTKCHTKRLRPGLMSDHDVEPTAYLVNSDRIARELAALERRPHGSFYDGCARPAEMLREKK